MIEPRWLEDSLHDGNLVLRMHFLLSGEHEYIATAYAFCPWRGQDLRRHVLKAIYRHRSRSRDASPPTLLCDTVQDGNWPGQINDLLTANRPYPDEWRTEEPVVITYGGTMKVGHPIPEGYPRAIHELGILFGMAACCDLTDLPRQALVQKLSGVSRRGLGTALSPIEVT